MDQSTTHNDEAAIRSLLQEVVTAFNKADLEKLLSFHTDDIILMEPDMPIVKGKSQVRELFAAFEQKRISMNLDFEIQELEVTQDRAFVRGEVIKEVFERGNLSEQETGKFICLLKKQQGVNWLRTHVIVNRNHASGKN